MALLLFIETGTRTCSVALAEDAKTIASHQLENTQSHAKVLHELIEQTLIDTDRTMRDLNAVVVGAGPGSYTGLRIGMAAAKGIAFTLDIPFIALDTLKTAAIEAINLTNNKEAIYISTLNSRKGEIYYCVLNGEGKTLEESQPAVVLDLDFSKYGEKEIYIVDNCKNKIKNNKFDFQYNLLEIKITAELYVNEGFKSYVNGAFDNIVKKNPLYLKPFS